jgi:hypothetical protein
MGRKVMCSRHSPSASGGTRSKQELLEAKEIHKMIFVLHMQNIRLD